MSHCPRVRPDADFDVDVVIVGLGPVGATLANLLGLCGVSTLVLEREASAYHLPRAVHFDDEVMRIFQTIGLGDEIARDVILSPGMRFVDARGKVIIDWSRPAEISAMGWYPSYRFHQPTLERTLVNGLARWPGVTIRNRCDVFALDGDDDGVTVRYEDLSNGRLSSLRTRYVVGCDGARSLVRRFIGAGLIDLGFHERWLVVDAILKRDRPDLGDYSLQHCNAERPVTYVRGIGPRRRWEITLRPDEDSHAITAPDRVWSLLQQWITPDDGDLERAAVYTFHSVIAAQWRAGRLLLAGDSAHQTPPFLGQGMCAGIRDAANLAWKLMRVLQGGDDALLGSYESERAPHVRDYIELAIRLGGVINTSAIEAGLPPGERTANQPARMESRKPLLGHGLGAGDTTLIGQLAPQPRLRDGTRLDDRVGYGFCVLATPGFATTLSADERRRLANAGVAMIDDCTDAVHGWLAASGAQAVMVRPDRYVLGGVRDAADLHALLALVTPLKVASEPLPALPVAM